MAGRGSDVDRLRSELVTTGSVFDTQDLEQVSAEVFARAVLDIRAESGSNGS